MKSFELLLPGTIDEAVRSLPTEDTLEARRGTKLLAGGQDLLGELKDHLEEPATVVDLKGIPGLDRIEPTPDGGLELGALVTVAALGGDPGIRRRFGLLAEAAASVGSPQIRNQGTLGGNLCQRPRCWYYRSESTVCLKKGGSECFAYEGMSKYNAILGGGPSYIVHPSDLAPALVALDARVDLAGPDGGREMALEDFYLLPAEGDVTKETRLGPDELVTRVRIPGGRSDWVGTYQKVREREGFDFALAAVALSLRLEGGTIRGARLVLGGVAPRPWRSRSTEELLLGRRIDDETCRMAGEDALRLAEPLEHNGYKVRLTRGLITRALRLVHTSF